MQDMISNALCFMLAQSLLLLQVIQGLGIEIGCERLFLYGEIVNVFADKGLAIKAVFIDNGMLKTLDGLFL